MKFFFLIFIISCTTIPEQKLPNKNYAYNLTVKANDIPIEGVGVIPENSFYSLDIEGREKIDKLTILSCSQYITSKSNNNKINIKYHRNDLERRLDICQMYIEALNESKQKHGIALIDFLNNKYKLNAYITCNGKTQKVSGISICQNFANNYLTIAFDENSRCINSCNDYDNNKKTHDIKIPEGKCIWLCNNGKEQHRLTTIGFTDEL